LAWAPAPCFNSWKAVLKRTIPFAPPFLKDGNLLISHVANILFYLGPRLGLAPTDEGLRYAANGLQLTITDFVCEVHDTHHPISTARYYEDQKAEAKARSAAFIGDRIPKYLGYFERILQQNPNGPEHIVGAELSYVDLSLFQVIEGLNYAFPTAMNGYADRYSGLAALHQRVRMRPKLPPICPRLAGLPSTKTASSGIIRNSIWLARHPIRCRLEPGI
jgi:glutathione S-transferase